MAKKNKKAVVDESPAETNQTSIGASTSAKNSKAVPPAASLSPSALVICRNK